MVVFIYPRDGSFCGNFAECLSTSNCDVVSDGASEWMQALRGPSFASDAGTWPRSSVWSLRENSRDSPQSRIRLCCEFNSWPLWPLFCTMIILIAMQLFTHRIDTPFSTSSSVIWFAQEFDDPRDAEDACYELNGKELLGDRILVEMAKGTERGRGGLPMRGDTSSKGLCLNALTRFQWTIGKLTHFLSFLETMFVGL